MFLLGLLVAVGVRTEAHMPHPLEARLGAITFGAPKPPLREPTPTPWDTTATLNRLLRHELAAFEAYERASGMLNRTTCRAQLDILLEGHRQRRDALHVLVVARHAQPVTSSGVWGVVVRVAENTANLLGTRMVIATLHDVEQRGVADYHRELPNVDKLTRAQIEMELLPAQEDALFRISYLSKHPPEDAI